MKVLVTGGGGFLGTYIIKELIKSGNQVICLGRHTYTHIENLGVRCLCCDLSIPSEIEALELKNIDAIIHTAAYAGVWGSRKYFEAINQFGAINLSNKAKKSGVKYFIYTSTPSVVFGCEDICGGDEKMPYPKKYFTDYARTKAIAERHILELNTDNFKTIAIRPHLIWGVGDPHLIPRLIEKAKSDKLKQVGDGNNLVDIIHVRNAAIAHIDALLALNSGNDIGGNAYFIGQEVPVNLWDFLNKILLINKLEPITKKISFRKAYFLGTLMEIIFKVLCLKKVEPPMTRFIALQLAKSHYFSHKKAAKAFNYQVSMSIEDGLNEMREASCQNLKETAHQ